MCKKAASTFDREMKNQTFKVAFKESYKTFLISELLIAMMDTDNKSEGNFIQIPYNMY